MISLPGYDAWRLAEPPMAPEEPEEEYIVELHLWVRMECPPSEQQDAGWDVARTIEKALKRHLKELEHVTEIEEITCQEITTP